MTYGYGVAVVAVFGVAIYPLVKDWWKERVVKGPKGPMTDFEWATDLWKRGVVDDAGYESLVLLINNPDVEFHREEVRLIEGVFD